MRDRPLFSPFAHWKKRRSISPIAKNWTHFIYSSSEPSIQFAPAMKSELEICFQNPIKYRGKQFKLISIFVFFSSDSLKIYWIAHPRRTSTSLLTCVNGIWISKFIPIGLVLQRCPYISHRAIYMIMRFVYSFLLAKIININTGANSTPSTYRYESNTSKQRQQYCARGHTQIRIRLNGKNT